MSHNINVTIEDARTTSVDVTAGYSDTQAVSAINAEQQLDVDISGNANTLDNNDSSYYLDHRNATNVVSDQHHTRYSDSEATSAVGGSTPWTNSDLVNSAVTVAGNQVSLGSSTSVASTDLSDAGSVAHVDEAETVTSPWTFTSGIDAGTMELPTDGGVVQLADMPVTDSPAVGEEMAFTLAVDAQNALRVRGEADGSGGLQDISVEATTAIDYSPQSSAPPHRPGRVALADGTNWDPDGDGNAELVTSDGSTWNEIVDYGTTL